MKGRKRQILVDTQGFLLACRVESAGTSDRRAARGLTAGLSPLWPQVHTVIADAGYESKGLAQDLRDRNDWRLVIVKRREQAFRIAGLNWIVERTFAWLGAHSGASGRLFQRHPVSHSEVSGHPEMTPLSVVT